MSDEADFTNREYLALWHRFQWTAAQVDEMPPWLVRKCLEWAHE